MYKDAITFQLATHFLSRIALRLEFLFKAINQACNESHEVIHRYALKNLVELMDIIEKPELKSRFIKELIRIEHVLKKQQISVNASLFDALEQQIHILNHVPGRFCNSIYEDQFLKTLRQIHHPNTKECEFNSPFLIMWLDLEPKIRQKAINQWVNALKDLETTVMIYLSLLKESAKHHNIQAQNGFYQHAFPPKTNNHLILLQMNKSLGMIPKLQLGHHNLTIRLYDLASATEIHDKNIDMDIAFCQI